MQVLAEVGEPDKYSLMTFTKDRLVRSFSDNPFGRLDLYEVDMTLSNIEAAKYFLDKVMPISVKKIGHLKVSDNIPF